MNSESHVAERDEIKSLEGKHQPAEYVHRDEREWETIRWPGQTGKMLFHPRPERPTDQCRNRRYEAGRTSPVAHHEFAQFWYNTSANSGSAATLCAGTMVLPGPSHRIAFRPQQEVNAFCSIGTDDR